MERIIDRKLLTSTRICALVLLLAAGYFASSVLIPFVTAIIGALFLDPVVTQLQNRGLTRRLATSLTLLAFFAVFVAGGWGVYYACARTLDQAPLYIAKLHELGFFPDRTTPFGAPGGTAAFHWMESFSSWRDFLLHLLGSAFQVISLAFFVPLMLFYFLLEKSDLVESMNTLTGRFWYLPKFNQDIPRMVRAFFKGNLIGGLLLAVLHGALFSILHLGNAPGLALISGFLSLIPLLGSPLAIALPLAQGLLQWSLSDPWPFLALVGFILLFHLVVGNVVLPQIIGNRINVNPAALVLGLLFWGWMWGAMGFLLAIPLTAAIKIALENNESTYTLANLMAARPRHVLFRIAPRRKAPTPLRPVT